MPSRSGKYGKILIGASEIQYGNKWEFNDDVDASQFGVFGGGGKKKGNVGQGFGKGTIDGVYDFAAPIEKWVNTGDSLTLLLYLTTVASGSADRFITVPAQITGRKRVVDGDTGAVVGWHLDFQTDGAWTEPT